MLDLEVKGIPSSWVHEKKGKQRSNAFHLSLTPCFSKSTQEEVRVQSHQRMDVLFGHQSRMKEEN